MSNVRRLEAERRRSPRALNGSLSRSGSIGAAKKGSLNSASSLLVALHEWSAPAQARSKANVSQSIGPLLRIGSTSAARKAFVAWHLGNSYSLPMQANEAFHTETPNPSIERTRSGNAGLASISFWAKPALPPRAAHVKR